MRRGGLEVRRGEICTFNASGFGQRAVFSANVYGFTYLIKIFIFHKPSDLFVTNSNY